MENKFSLKEFIKSGAVMLTPQNVCDVIGKEIEWSHPCYHGNRETLEKGKVLRVTTEWELAKEDKSTADFSFANRAEYWERELPATAARAKKTLRLEMEAENENGVYRHSFIWLSDWDKENPFFACSDEDRPVFFKLAK